MSWSLWKNGGWLKLDKDEAKLLNEEATDIALLARTDGTYECNKKALTYKVIEEGDAIPLPMMFVAEPSGGNPKPPEAAQPPKPAQPAAAKPAQPAAPAAVPAREEEPPKRVLLWCDPKVNDDNKNIERIVAEKKIEHYRKFSCTDELMRHWEELGKPNENCRIMTCAVRNEDARGMDGGAQDFLAWAKLAARLREGGYTGRILIFCGDTSHLESNRDTIKYNVTYTKRTKDATDFATFC